VSIAAENLLAGGPRLDDVFTGMSLDTVCSHRSCAQYVDSASWCVVVIAASLKLIMESPVVSEMLC